MKRIFPTRFAAKEEGGISIEAVLMFPILVWAITATFVFFDAFKTLHVSQKATFTVADMMSRETEEVSDDYLTAMHELYGFIANGTIDQTSIRFSVVKRGVDENGNELTELVDSKGLGVPDLLTLDTIAERIPLMVVGDSLIVVETENEWSPTFAVGLASYRFREVTVVRPRFAPTLVFQTGVGGSQGSDPVTTGNDGGTTNASDTDNSGSS